MNKQEIDWSKAPEWATHYGLAGRFKHPVWVSDDRYTYADGRQGGKVYSISRGEGWSIEELYTVSSRPAAWNGTGLPPVGTVCEALWNEASDTWLKSKVFGANEHGQPIHRWEEGPRIYEYQASPLHGPNGTAYFRPIRTPEQIAAEERDKARTEVLNAMTEAGAADEPQPLWEHRLKVVGEMLDMGFRKIDTSQPSHAEISSDIKQANINLLADKVLQIEHENPTRGVYIIDDRTAKELVALAKELKQ